VNQNLLAVFSTYYLWIGLISFAALFMFAFTQRLGNEKTSLLF
jgi:hypothetical protein